MTTNWKCPIHGSQEGESPYLEPTQEELIEELVAHLNGHEHQPPTVDPICGYCHEEWEVRSQGQESVNLYDDYLQQLVKEECICEA